MATPRSPYVCIGDSLLDEPWPREVKATLVLLSCHMHSRWRADRRLTLETVAASHPVGPTDAMKITGKHRLDIAWKSLRSLADFASMSVELRHDDGIDIAWIRWPKWAEYNQAVTRERGNRESPESPSASASAEALSEAGEEKSPNPSGPDHDSPPRGDSPSPPEARQVGEAGSGGERSAPRARGSRLPPPEVFERVDSLASAILASVPGQRTPRTNGDRDRWAVDLGRLHRLDNQPWELIDEVIAWLPTHEGSNGFAWGRVVLSARKFRERFPQLVAQMRAPPAKERLSFEEQHRRELERFDQRCKRGEHESDAQAD